MRASATLPEVKGFALRKGDVIVTKDSESPDDIAVPAYVDSDFDDVLCGYHLALVRPRDKVIDGRFLYYCFAAEGINLQFQVAANGITRYGLTRDGFGSALFPVPPLDKQHAIADWLDQRSALVDEIIEKKERLIELLKEERQALINHAITAGVELRKS
jgi:type I restriction enzyme S subunit